MAKNQNFHSMSKSHKISITLLKYTPVISALCMAVHIALLLLGYKSPAEAIVGITFLPSLVLLTTSHAFHFCLLHKLLICYTFVVNLCCKYERLIGFGELLTPARVIMLLVGLRLLIAVSKHQKKCSTSYEDFC